MTKLKIIHYGVLDAKRLPCLAWSPSYPTIPSSHRLPKRLDSGGPSVRRLSPAVCEPASHWLVGQRRRQDISVRVFVCVL